MVAQTTLLCRGAMLSITEVMPILSIESNEKVILDKLPKI